jgi:hypothetical protein
MAVETPPITKRDDFTTIDGLLSAMYDTISGPAGVEPDWDRERSLFAPGGRLIPTRAGPDGQLRVHLLTVDEYIDTRATYLRENAFYEREVMRRVEQFGHVAQVFSIYESADTPDGPAFVRGVNLIQLIFTAGRWWIQSILWENDIEGATLPDSFPAA